MEERLPVTVVSVDELVIPASIEAEDAGDFIEMTRVRNRISADTTGSLDLAVAPAELLPSWHEQRFEPKRMLVARVEGRIVGRAIAELPLGDTPAAWITVEVLREFRRRGIGAALYASIEGVAVAAGKTVLQSFVVQDGEDSVERITAPTGFGSVPRDSDATRFLLARGFALEQVTRISRLELPADRRDLRRRFVGATAMSRDYHLAYWTGGTPDEWLGHVARLRSRLATDAPQAGLEPDLSPWTPERVRATDELAASSPVRSLTALAVHSPSGTAAGYTRLEAPRQVGRPVSQGDTIVLQEHRGHRLGMTLKVANLLRLEEVLPGHPSVVNYTAEENRHMLALNESLGFLPWGYEGAWKRVLS
jgi:GNAT superfamily N-acetyltransferase